MNRLFERITASVGGAAPRAALVASCLLVAAPALAQSDQEKAIARSAGMDGSAALGKQDYKAAADLFRKAIAIFDEAKAPSVPPTLLVGLARAEAGRKRYVSAQEAYSRAIHQTLPPGASPELFAAVEAARKESDEAEKHLAYVVIKVSGCDKPSLAIDDRPVSSAAIGLKTPVDPGEHVVTAKGAGCKAREVTFAVPEAGSTTVTVALEPQGASVNLPAPSPVAHAAAPDNAQSSAPSPSRAGAWIALGVGAAGLATGAIGYALNVGERATATEHCSDALQRCDATGKAADDRVGTLNIVTVAGAAVGVVGAFVGTWLLLRSPSNGVALRVGPSLTAGAAGVNMGGTW